MKGKVIFMMSKSVLSKREQIFNVVYKLLDEYHMYGHFYGDDGGLLSRYYFIYTDENDMCIDSEGRTIMFDPSEDGLFGTEYDKYLDVHNCSVFVDWTREQILSLSVDEILDKYLKYYIPKLISMLRKGHNYANATPVENCYRDDYLCQQIAMAWKFLVAETINCRDVKHKLIGIMCDEDFYYKDYSWDRRAYARKLFEDSDHMKFMHISVKRKELSKAEAMERSQFSQAERAKKEEENLRVIGVSTPKQVIERNEELIALIKSQLKW